MGHYRIRCGDDWQVIFLKGRDEWALCELISMGELGCTPIHNPAPRWSSYIHNLRRMGVDIETIHEPHRGPFPGRHARYVLRAIIEPMEDRDAA